MHILQDLAQDGAQSWSVDVNVVDTLLVLLDWNTSQYRYCYYC